jgi:hypothetical protein
MDAVPRELMRVLEARPADIEGRLYPSPRGYCGCQRNF